MEHMSVFNQILIYSLDADRKEILKSAMRQVGVKDEESRYLRAIDRLKSALIELKHARLCSAMNR